jgi:hypothetical protein
MNYSNINCNHLPIPVGAGGVLQIDHSITTGTTQVWFHNIEDKIIAEIDKHAVAIGCIAWLTNPRILTALASKQVSILVQKETRLRTPTAPHEIYTRQLYNALTKVSRFCLPGIASDLSTHEGDSSEAIRCVGLCPTLGPRMHHKFLVFCDWFDDGENSPTVVPKVVCTGSYNFTQNSVKSWENAIFFHDQRIALAYAKEFSQLLAFSEPLDWESKSINPQLVFKR